MAKSVNRYIITFIYCVILNEVKNLQAFTLCLQILRDAQDDTTEL